MNKSLLESIDEALAGFNGATRDRRQQLGDTDLAGQSLYDELTGDWLPNTPYAPGEWDVQIAYGESFSPPASPGAFASERGTSSEYISGPVGVRLIGHAKMTPEQFNELMDSLWTTHCRQVVMPDHYDVPPEQGAKSGYQGAASTKEVRNLCKNGRYGRAWRHRFPMAQDMFDELVSLLDDLCHFPEMAIVFSKPRYIRLATALPLLRRHLEDLTSSKGRRTHQNQANTPTTPPPGDFSI